MGSDWVHAAQVVLPCAELDPTLAFFTERLGFRVETIYPADDPSVAVVSGFGLRVQLHRGAQTAPGVIYLLASEANEDELTAPNGTRVVFFPVDPPLEVPPVRPSLVVTEDGDDSLWRTGRAGMLYRDLVPDRQGGSFIASHIRIPEGGPVPDYVHFHKVQFQMIYCYKGWVRVVYEYQGEPFVMQAGDCVLQPPQIRHRVLESSPGLEVIEIGCPASHVTHADHDLPLPNSIVKPQREFSGQRFVHHVAANATWRPFRIVGFEYRDTGIAAATGGLASVRVARGRGTFSTTPSRHGADFLFTFVLQGALTLQCEGCDDRRLTAGAAFVVPPEMRSSFAECSPDLEILEVVLPAEFDVR